MLSPENTPNCIRFYILSAIVFLFHFAVSLHYIMSFFCPNHVVFIVSGYISVLDDVMYDLNSTKPDSMVLIHASAFVGRMCAFL